MGYTGAVKVYLDEMEGIRYLPKRRVKQMADFDITRWRSFAERYLIERAATFEYGKDIEGIWDATNNALAAYQHIYNVGVVNAGKDMAVTFAAPATPEQQTLNALSAIHAPKDDPWYQSVLQKFKGAGL